MNFYLLIVLLLLSCSLFIAIDCSPVGHDDDADEDVVTTRRPFDDEDATSSTHPTFTVQRLDAPIERIEIRLIDETTTRSVQEVTESTVRDDQQEQARKEHLWETTTEQPRHIYETDQAAPPLPPTDPIPAGDEMYKKVEYVVQPTHPVDIEQDQVHIPRAEAGYDEVSTSPAEPIVIGEDPSYFSTMSSEKQANAEAKAWISVSVSSTIPKFEGDIDEDDLPPPPASEGEESDEPEEECLANKDKLSEEVVERLRHETTTYYRLVRQRNEQQKEYCSSDVVSDSNSEMYRRCNNWRAEKLVYYYKLMRKTYCQVDNWPNSPKIKKTYGEYLNLFGTFYAFQK